MPLDFETITLNAIPDGEMPVFHASQFETMRPFIAVLKWGTEDFAPGEGCWCTLSIRKTDDTLVIIDDIDISTNTISCVLTQQSVACIGDNFCQLKVWSTEDGEDGCIACLNFILHVQPDPEANGIISASEINNLTQQIADIVPSVIGNDYYNKTEVDTLLADKADSNSVYTKVETDTLLSAKADVSDVYTKVETDTLLSAKANTSDLATVATTGDYDDLLNKPTIPAAQVQSDYAQADNTQVDYIKNKPDITAMIAAALFEVMPVGTESGPIASFDTEIDAPLVNVTVDVEATGGNGTPDSPNPIVGCTEANITRCGVNLFDKDSGNVLNAYLSTKIEALAVCRTIYAKCKPSTQYTVSKTAGQRFIVAYTKETPAINVDIYGSVQDATASHISITTGADAKYIVAMVYNGNVDSGTADEMLASVQIAEGTDTTYHAYTGNTYTVSFGQTVYGGQLDVTNGVLKSGKDKATYNGSEGWTEFARGTDTVVYALQNAVASILNENDQISNMFTYNSRAFDVALNTPNIFVLGSSKRLYVQVSATDYPTVTDFQTALSNNNLEVLYNITEQSYNLTPEVISAIVGTNNVYSDTNGDTTVQYKDSIQHYIDSRV